MSNFKLLDMEDGDIIPDAYLAQWWYALAEMHKMRYFLATWDDMSAPTPVELEICVMVDL